MASNNIPILKFMPLQSFVAGQYLNSSYGVVRGVFRMHAILVKMDQLYAQ